MNGRLLPFSLSAGKSLSQATDQPFCHLFFIQYQGRKREGVFSRESCGAGRPSVFELCGLFCQGSTTGTHSSLSPFCSHVAGWQGAELQVTVHLTGRQCFSTVEVFPPQRSHKDLFQRARRQAECVVSHLALRPVWSQVFLSQIGYWQRGAVACTALTLCFLCTRISLKF